MGIEAKHAYRFEYLKSEKWSTVRIEALAREKGKCQICGDESIHNDAHHVWYPESIWDTTEAHLVVLCRCCHEFLHVMLPECKTGDEESGKSQWTRFRNAIIVWRLNKQSLFELIPEATVGLATPKDLRAGYESLRRKYVEATKLLKGHQIEISESLVPEKSSKNDPNKRANGKKLDQDLQQLVFQIYKWARKKFRAGDFDDDFPVDNPDYQI